MNKQETKKKLRHRPTKTTKDILRSYLDSPKRDRIMSIKTLIELSEKTQMSQVQCYDWINHEKARRRKKEKQILE